jgi:hypothetical protein
MKPGITLRFVLPRLYYAGAGFLRMNWVLAHSTMLTLRADVGHVARGNHKEIGDSMPHFPTEALSH